MSAEKKNDEDLARLQRAAEQLLEHFDTVHIFTCRNDPEQEGALHMSWGAGNWFTRYGQIGAWKVREDERLRVEERSPDA